MKKKYVARLALPDGAVIVARANCPRRARHRVRVLFHGWEGCKLPRKGNDDITVRPIRSKHVWWEE